jgi:hypothetical protein
MLLYISGPMTGIPEFNYPAFNAAAAQLRERGYTVINPAELDHKSDASWEDYLRVDIAAMLPCDNIYMLKDWERSRGAKLEHTIARQLGMAVYYQ